ncbi:MAG: hypothetical protein K6F81_03095 [Acholeplasmatales bacterium]|jgi:hypothetical protein|nr:hypothetical protein [Acholeplasmatales bacterium]
MYVKIHEYEVASEFWNIFLIIAIAALFIFLILLFIIKPLKNEYYHPFHNDILFKEYKEAGVLNQIFSTYGETNNYIKRYALRKSSFDTSVVTNYVGNYSVIDYYVVSYNKRGKPISALLVTERKNDKSSRIISVKKSTYRVNIIIKSVDGMEINKNIIRPQAIGKIRIYSALVAFASFNVFYIVSRIAILFAGDFYVKFYNKTSWNFFAFLAMILLSLLIYIFTVIKLRKKNSKNRNGGLEYEFY